MTRTQSTSVKLLFVLSMLLPTHAFADSAMVFECAWVRGEPAVTKISENAPSVLSRRPTAYSEHLGRRVNKEGQLLGRNCADVADEFADAGYEIQELRGFYGSKYAVTYVAARIPSAPQEGFDLVSKSGPAKGCNCDDALPVGGHKCNYCFIWYPLGKTTGSCICNYKPK
ncbi:MAG: hypothetical protein AAF493_09000 [Pseudomonadota bacterium]